MAASKSYPQLSDELEAVLEELQSPEVDIDRALELYKQGQKLITEIGQYLESAENEVRKLTVGTNKPGRKKV